MKKILIVGGAGYIGSHVNKVVQESGYQTLILDNLSRGNRLTIFDTPFIQGDLCQTPLLDQIFETHEIDTVMHFAALTDVGESILNPAAYYVNNVSHTLNLLNAMVKHRVKKLIFSSSAAIFGHPTSPLINENHACFPINPYGQTKWMVEKLLNDFDQAYGLKFCSIRYFNAAGGDPQGKIKNHQRQATNLIPLILKNLKQDHTNVRINGTDYATHDGTCVRDYIHIDDIASGHILSLKKLNQTNLSCHYNLGNGRGYSVREVIQTVQKVTGKKLNVIECERRLGDPAVLIADPTKSIKELQWTTRYPLLETMIEHAWKALN